MDDKPLDLSKKILPSASENRGHSSEKRKKDDPLHPDKITSPHSTEFSKSDGNEKRAFEQESKRSVHSRRTNIENETLEFREMIPGSSVAIKRKMEASPAINSNRNIQDELRKQVVSDYIGRTEEDLIYPPGPSTSTGSGYNLHGFNINSSDIHAKQRGNKTFTTSGTLKKNEIKYTGERRFECDKCIKEYDTSFKLKVHYRKHTGELPFTCQKCNKKFFTKRALKVHNRKHTGERPFACKQCNKKFFSKEVLRVHYRMHTEGRHFTCEECNRAFTKSSELKEHSKIHSGHFVCNMCNKACISPSALVNHIRSHTGEKPYSCPTCGRAFSVKGNMKRHEKTHEKKSKEL